MHYITRSHVQETRQCLDEYWEELVRLLPREHDGLLGFLLRARRWANSPKGLQHLVEQNPRFLSALTQLALQEVCFRLTMLELSRTDTERN